MSVIRKVYSCNEMWFLWASYGCITVGLVCYMRHMVFAGRMEEMILRLSNTSQLQPREVNDNPTETAAAPVDIFDFCPFEPPDPWDETIVIHLNDKYGFLNNCTVLDSLQPVTNLADGKVLLKKGNEKYQCQARCIEYLFIYMSLYVADNEYTLSNWSAINGTDFNCDFVETNCKTGNITNRHIHMQTAEQKQNQNTSQNKLDPQKYPDVHLMVISVSSSQVIRGLPRTINFLMHGMGAVEFRKFNKVGLNSRPSAIRLLMAPIRYPIDKHRQLNLFVHYAGWNGIRTKPVFSATPSPALSDLKLSGY